MGDMGSADGVRSQMPHRDVPHIRGVIQKGGSINEIDIGEDVERV